MKHSIQIYIILICLVFSGLVFGQTSDLAATYPRTDLTVSQLLFEHGASGFSMVDAFRARSEDLAENHARLTVSGDFTGFHTLLAFDRENLALMKIDLEHQAVSWLAALIPPSGCDSLEMASVKALNVISSKARRQVEVEA